eukprot:GDKI01044467.1.p1 GENE.GDKI01044467.1~~GDKI01044467.1.p1  ORF type:complete len:369 (+),score=58.18 GDKI01044467.1:41-1108(+)
MLQGSFRACSKVVNSQNAAGRRGFAYFMADKIEDSNKIAPSSQTPFYNQKFNRVNDPKQFIDEIKNAAPAPQVHSMGELVKPTGNPHRAGRVLAMNQQATNTYLHYVTTREPVFPKAPEAGQVGQGAAAVRNFNHFNSSEPAIETAFKMSPDNVRPVGHENMPIPKDTVAYENFTFNEHRLAPGHADRRTFHYLMTAGSWAASLSFVRAALCTTMHFAWIGKDLMSAGSVEVDLGSLEVGQNMSVKYRGKPVFIRHRTPEQIAISRKDDALMPTMKDPQLDADRAPKPHFLIVMGVCTHLGCIPVPDEGTWKGYFCPCHGSHYDLSGRIRAGPAPSNLEIPPYVYLSDTSIKIGA